MAAENLAVGDTLKLITGEEVEIQEIELEKLEEPIQVYNFEVEDWHTYYATEHGILVHNKGTNPCVRH